MSEECDVTADQTCKVCLPCEIADIKSATNHQYQTDDGFLGWLWGETVWSVFTQKAYDLDVILKRTQNVNSESMREHCVVFVEALRILKTVLMCFPCRSSYNAFHDASPPHAEMSFRNYIHATREKVNAKLNKPEFPYSSYYDANIKDEEEKAWRIQKVSSKWYYSFFSFLYMVALNFAFSFAWEIPRHIEMLRDVNRLFTIASDLIPSPAVEFRQFFESALRTTCSDWSCYLHNASQRVHARADIFTSASYKIGNAAEADAIVERNIKAAGGQEYYFFHRRDIFHFVHDLELNLVKLLCRKNQPVESMFGTTCTNVQHYFEHHYRAKPRHV